MLCHVDHEVLAIGSSWAERACAHLRGQSGLDVTAALVTGMTTQESFGAFDYMDLCNRSFMLSNKWTI